VLIFFGFFIIVHYVVGIILTLGQFPLILEIVVLDELFEIIPDGSWFDCGSVNIIGQNIIEGLVCEASLSY